MGRWAYGEPFKLSFWEKYKDAIKTGAITALTICFIVSLVTYYIDVTGLNKQILKLEDQLERLEEENNRVQSGNRYLTDRYISDTVTKSKELDEKKIEHAPSIKSLGTYKLTYYCSCSECSGDNGAITASGTVPRANHTVAADPDLIPQGSKLVIDGQEYVVEDVGGAIKGEILDIYVDSHEEALQKGVDYEEVGLMTE